LPKWEKSIYFAAQKNSMLKIGIDVGSTTLKIIVLDEKNEIVHKIYRRHKADIQVVFAEELAEINRLFPSARLA
jgi:activator of 2-hydroxyglutaryl-CoA dehydratase